MCTFWNRCVRVRVCMGRLRSCVQARLKKRPTPQSKERLTTQAVLLLPVEWRSASLSLPLPHAPPRPVSPRSKRRQPRSIQQRRLRLHNNSTTTPPSHQNPLLASPGLRRKPSFDFLTYPSPARRLLIFPLAPNDTPHPRTITTPSEPRGRLLLLSSRLAETFDW